ncbi:MAG TPA: hypothetical protein VEI74_04580, partial [Candidatus Methylomirabilis sp.]|nr:hypothetical protein [Candidatus Methylomirabilis sp.]
RKETKRKHAPDGARILASAALGPALTRRDNPCRASQPQASCLRPFGRSPKALRGSGAPYGEEKNYCWDRAVIFEILTKDETDTFEDATGLDYFGARSSVGLLQY